MNRRYRRWEQRVFALTQRMDSILLRLVVAAVILLIGTQIALRSSLFLTLFSRVDRFEGTGQANFARLAAWERLLAEKTVSSQGDVLHVSLELLQPKPSPKIKLLVNGVIYGDFAQGRLSVEVSDGDLIEIDTTEASESGTVRVRETSLGLQKPMVGQYLQAKQEIRPLGRVEANGIR
ncbi:MAG: hypothetical protein ACM3ZQ_03665 [Bacillota bacterium]